MSISEDTTALFEGRDIVTETVVMFGNVTQDATTCTALAMHPTTSELVILEFHGSRAQILLNGELMGEMKYTHARSENANMSDIVERVSVTGFWKPGVKRAFNGQDRRHFVVAKWTFHDFDGDLVTEGQPIR